MIGLGYFLGPLLGLAGQLLSGGDPARARTATVVLVWTAAAGIGLAALRPYAAVRLQENGLSLSASSQSSSMAKRPRPAGRQADVGALLLQALAQQDQPALEVVLDRRQAQRRDPGAARGW